MSVEGGSVKRWEGSFLAYALVGFTVQRTIEGQASLELAPGVFVPTLTNKMTNMIHEHGMNLHSPTQAHLMRACQDCDWADFKEDANGA